VIDSVQFRAGAASDAVTIAALATQVFLDTYAADGVRPDLAREAFHVCSTEAFAARLTEPNRKFVLAVRDDAVLGFAEVLCEPTRAPAGHVSGSELVRLYVQPQAQGEGIGRALIIEAERLAEVALWLTVWDRNVGALAFYSRMGYADIGASTYTFEGRSYGNRVFAKTALTAA
jgi:GNAT superfamily N-acetyltransferase